MIDESAVLLDGPWRHDFVAANGARFHVALSGPTDRDAPLVILLHGFPQFWWSWRHQLVSLSAAGYRVAAMDLRGSGASDKPPIGYDLPTLARDVAGVIRSLGARHAVIIGHGMGGTVAWSMPALHPGVTRAVAAFSAPHPLRMHAVGRRLLRPAVAGWLLYFQLPWFPEHRLMTSDLAVRLLRGWGAPDWLDEQTARTYDTGIQVPFAAHSAMESLRWLVRSTPRIDGQRYLAALRSAAEVPALQVYGTADGCLDAGAVARDLRRATPNDVVFVPGAGHFVPEEAPQATDELLLSWLDRLSP